MAVATYTSDLTDIFLFESTTSVTAWGGGASGLGASPDYAVQGTNAVDKQVSAAEKGFMYDNTSNFTIGADDHFFIWATLAVYGLADTRNNRGIQVNIGDDTSNFVKFHVAGSDTLPLGGANPYAVRFVNTTLTNFRTLVGSPGTTPSWIGVGANVTGTAKFSNLAADAARIGTGYDILNGTGADPEADFAGIASDDETTREGVFYSADGGFKWQGKLRIGSASTACEFLDSNTNLFIVDTIHSLTDFTEFLVENSSSIVTLSNVNFIALGTNNPGRLEAITSAATLTFTNVGFIDFGATILGTGSTFSGCRWIGAGIVTANGADLSDSSISGYEGTADTSPLIWDVATDPDGKLDNMTFTKGTAATHAIEFGTTSPLTMTVRGMTATGYNSANANNDSTFHVKRTSGTVTINVINGTGNFSYRTDGATVNIVIDPVSTKFTVKDVDGAAIQNARVLAETADNGGGSGLPYEAAVTTLTQSAGTATLTASSPHGLATNDYVVIRGAQPDGYNKVAQITVTSTTVFTYTVPSGLSSPATGTPIFSYCPIGGLLTNASGVVTSSKTWPASQGLKGWARKKNTSSPFYKDGDITVADASGGTDQTITLQLDE